MKTKSLVSLISVNKAALSVLVAGFAVVAPVIAQGSGSTGNSNVQVQASEPEVSVEQAEPEISVVQPTPEVRIERAEPNVVVKEAQPEVEVKQADPKITIVESEPKIEIIDGDKTAQSRQQEAPASEQQQYEAAQMPGPQQDSGGAQQESATLTQMEVAQVQGMDVQNQLGESLGSVEDIVVDRQTGRAGLVIAVGGFWGFGETEVFVPADEVALQNNDTLVWQMDLPEEVIEEQAQYDEQNFASVIE